MIVIDDEDAAVLSADNMLPLLLFFLFNFLLFFLILVDLLSNLLHKSKCQGFVLFLDHLLLRVDQ